MKYVAAFKKRNKNAAARNSDISEKWVRDRKNAGKNYQGLPLHKCSNRGQKQEKWPRLEKEIAVWVIPEKQGGKIVTRDFIRWKTSHWVTKNEDDSIHINATASWGCCFTHCRDLGICHQKRKLAHHLSRNLDHNIIQLQLFVINQKKQN